MNAEDHKSRVVEPGNYSANGSQPLHLTFASTQRKENRMNKFKSYLSDGIARISNARNPKACRLWATIASFGLALIFTLVAAQAEGQTPTVFQAAGPNAASIQSTVDAFRGALGNPNNGNTLGSLASGRREINWDGGGNNDTTTAPVTPFDVFLNTRGARFTTRGTGLSQAPPAGGPQGGLAVLFDNPTYGTIFSTFSPLRLFTPVGSNITEGLFFVPGSNGGHPATVSGFGAVFTDVDRPTGSGPARNRRASTLIEYFGSATDGKDDEDEDDDDDGKLLFKGVVPASPGDGSLSFFGIVFKDARIARVRITSGNVAPGPDDGGKRDVVVMDDFIYGEPQALP